MAQSANRRSKRSSSSSSNTNTTTTTTSTTTNPVSLFRAASEKLTAVSKRSSRKNTQTSSVDPIVADTPTSTTSQIIRIKNRKGGRPKKKKVPADDPVGNSSIHHRLYPDRTSRRSSPLSDERPNDPQSEHRTKQPLGEQTDVPPSMIQLGFGEFIHVENVDLFELDCQHGANDTEDEEEAFERELEEERRRGLDTLYRDVGRILYLDIQAAQTLLSSLILILVQEGPMLDRSLPPEQQSEEAKARLDALAHSICVSVECVQRVSRSWPHVGVWLVTKAFDVWIGRL
ncbi:hypothetical protein [Phaffia rhodozyma]|uniref:Uncharacterized protein n=1 Tax=Phaffia rhodozyma TaxID=264483 RepID=A0A0F7SQU5_PHARH|nr:hypothetical protein [Phaffia rhodozyma]